MRNSSAGAFLDAAKVCSSPIEEHSVAISVALHPALTHKQAMDSVLNDQSVLICNESYVAEQLFDQGHQCLLIATLVSQSSRLFLMPMVLHVD